MKFAVTASVNTNQKTQLVMPKSNESKVHVVDKSEYRAAARTLADAFAEDEVARYFIDLPDTLHWSDENKWNLHLSIMEYITYAHCLRGLVTTTGDDYGCVALWMPPGQNMDDYLTIFRSGLWRLIYKLSREGRSRFFTEFFPLLHNTKLAVLGDRDHDSHYLVYLGTKPAYRGQGLAKRLIEHTTQKADVEGRACYLESSSVLNLGLYRRLGFVLVQKISLCRGQTEVDMHIMVREPMKADTQPQQEVTMMSQGVPITAHGVGMESVTMKIQTKPRADKTTGDVNPPVKAYSALKTGDKALENSVSI